MHAPKCASLGAFASLFLLASCAIPPVARDAIPLPGGFNIVAARQATTTEAPAANPPATATTSNTSPSPCFTESVIDIKTCVTETPGKKAVCGPAKATVEVCRPELICQVDRQGNPSCMYKQKSLGLAGTIVAIFFASAIAISAASICFFCCREQRVQKRLRRAAEAAKIAQEAKTQAMVNAKKVQHSGGDDGLDRQPLMGSTTAGGGPASGGNHPPLPQVPQHYADEYSSSQYDGPGSGGYGDSRGHGQNPFADSHDSHPLR